MIRQRFLPDDRGAVLTEFAFVAPVMCLFLVGGFDIAHSLYMQADIQGAVQKAARDAGLESGATATQQAALDAKVTAQVKALANNATLTFKRRFFRTFSKAAAAKSEQDANGNGKCEAGERYIDANNNNRFDDDGGDEGQGGAKDKVVYTVTVSYPRMLPLNKFIPSLPADQTFTVKTVLQNQPYTDQASYTAAAVERDCP